MCIDCESCNMCVEVAREANRLDRGLTNIVISSLFPLNQFQSRIEAGASQLSFTSGQNRLSQDTKA